LSGAKRGGEKGDPILPEVLNDVGDMTQADDEKLIWALFVKPADHFAVVLRQRTGFRVTRMGVPG